MYPYNIKNVQKQNNIKLSNTNLVMSQEPQESPEIENMLMEALRDEDHDFRYYTSLSDAIEDTDDAEIVKSMAYDEYKHMRLIEEVYYALTGTMPEKVDVTMEPLSNDLMVEFSNSFFKELDGVEFYRTLMSSFENASVRDVFFEILTDEQSHASILNYLITKYK